MTTGGWAVARKSAWRWASTARQRCLENGPSTVTGDVVEESFLATSAHPLVAQICAHVIPAPEWPTALARADMLSLHVSIDPWYCYTKRLHFTLRSLSFDCLALACAASLTTLVTAAVQCGLAQSHALRWLLSALMTDSSKSVAAATT